MIDVCSGAIIVLKFTRFQVYCSLKYEWYPFDTQVENFNLMKITVKYYDTLAILYCRYAPFHSIYLT